MDLAQPQTPGPWDWSLSTILVVIGLAVTLVIAIIGWIITAIHAKKDAQKESGRTARASAETERRHQEQLSLLNERLQTSQDSAKALREQVKQLEESNRLFAAANPEEKAPWGDSEWTGIGELFRIHLEGTRTVTVTRIGAAEPELEGLLDLEYPKRVAKRAGAGRLHRIPCNRNDGRNPEHANRMALGKL
ncbi:MAG: hypothetical protein ABF806_02505 [Bifidobacterium psychraerophilum]|uniref:hypothetical protein n=1 Tax=Bifidobacterium psychraerophilum TaxID=218140 RepID=UPI0039EB3716